MRAFTNVLCAAFFVTMTCGLGASPALAQNYTQLQVLLPGEAAAPGTGTGKVGSPSVQTVGVPFTILVRACDPSWNTVTTVNNTVSLSSSDPTASIPGQATISLGRFFPVPSLAVGPGL